MNIGGSAVSPTDTPSQPEAVDRATFQAELERLRVREKAHTREGDAIAAPWPCHADQRTPHRSVVATRGWTL